jgi:hypothetical protein
MADRGSCASGTRVNASAGWSGGPRGVCARHAGERFGRAGRAWSERTGARPHTVAGRGERDTPAGPRARHASLPRPLPMRLPIPPPPVWTGGTDVHSGSPATPRHGSRRSLRLSCARRCDRLLADTSIASGPAPLGTRGRQIAEGFGVRARPMSEPMRRLARSGTRSNWARAARVASGSLGTASSWASLEIAVELALPRRYPHRSSSADRRARVFGAMCSAIRCSRKSTEKFCRVPSSGAYPGRGTRSTRRRRRRRPRWTTFVHSS